jgi:hypothetical protein
MAPGEKPGDRFGLIDSLYIHPASLSISDNRRKTSEADGE